MRGLCSFLCRLILPKSFASALPSLYSTRAAAPAAAHPQSRTQVRSCRLRFADATSHALSKSELLWWMGGWMGEWVVTHSPNLNCWDGWVTGHARLVAKSPNLNCRDGWVPVLGDLSRSLQIFKSEFRGRMGVALAWVVAKSSNLQIWVVEMSGCGFWLQSGACCRDVILREEKFNYLFHL